MLLGVAAGYLRPEFAALGVEFDERNDLFTETVELMRRAWRETASRSRPPASTRAASRSCRTPPPVPIWIGGNSTTAMHHAVELGDGWSPFPNPPAAARAVKTPAITNVDELAARLTAAPAYATELGRADPLTICFAPFASSDDHAVFAELGVDWLTIRFDGCTSRAEWLDRLGDRATWRGACSRANRIVRPTVRRRARRAPHGRRSTRRREADQ